MKIKLNYPVIVLPTKDDMIYVYFSEIDLKSTSEELLDKLDWASFEIVDRLGQKYKIKKAFKVKYRGLWGFNLFLKGRQVQIDFEYDLEIESISLEKLKEGIIRRIDKKRKFWEASWDIKDLKQKVYGGLTFNEIAEFLK